jgi:precorrin-6Y C5,15-methyltransferase (decarboxylating)
VLASGDPGFFGIGRALAARFGPEVLEVHPAPSSVALAFARLGLHWDDAVVVSAHGRPLADAARLVASCPKAAVLVSPASPPQALGRHLLTLGSRHRRAAVCARLGEPDEQVDVVDLEGLAAGDFDPLSVVVLLADSDVRQTESDGRDDIGRGGDAAVASVPSLAWGLPEAAYAHRDGMITKAEVRAVVIAKLALPSTGVLWDIGAGSGSVAIECARLASGLRVIAVERSAAAAALVRANAARHGVDVEVTEAEAPAVLAELADPDRAFVGGGGLGVLDAALTRLRPGGFAVATFAALDRAVAAYQRLGQLVQVAVSRAESLPDGGVRLEAENPVFVAWGPQP